MKKKYLEALISFCLGVSWVLSFAIGIYLFVHGLSVGYLSAFVLFIIGFTVGLCFVAFFEGLSLLSDLLAEKKEQTRILMDISTKLSLQQSRDEKISHN